MVKSWVINKVTIKHTDLTFIINFTILIVYLENSYRSCPKHRNTLPRMTWMINKVCFDPEREVSFDETYAKNRFSRRMRVNLPKLNLIFSTDTTTKTYAVISDVTSTHCDVIKTEKSCDNHHLITGNVPTYTDFLAYSCLHDLRDFVPECFTNNTPVMMFMRQMEGLTQLKGWFEGEEGEYIRPPRPSITTRIGYFA